MMSGRHVHEGNLLRDSLGGHLLADRTVRTRRGIGSPGPYSNETSSPPAPPIKTSAPSPRSAAGPSAPGLPNTAPAPASVGGSSRLSDFNYLNSTGGEQDRAFDNGATPPRQSPALGPSRPVHLPSPQGAPSIGDLDSAPDWGSGSGESHISDDGPDWGGIDDPEWTARKGFFRRSFSGRAEAVLMGPPTPAPAGPCVADGGDVWDNY
jgi:hypothetical protein